MDKDQLNKYQDSSWYRLLKVVFVSAMVLVLGGTILISLEDRNSQLSSYEYSSNKYNEYLNLQKEKEEEIIKLGEAVSLQGASFLVENNRDRGLQIYEQIYNRKYTSNIYYIDSDNGMWALLGDSLDIYYKLRSTLDSISSSMTKSPPSFPDLNRIYRYTFYAILIELVMFWLIKRIFYYIVFKDKFFKI
jgi:hypothetical protein